MARTSCPELVSFKSHHHSFQAILGSSPSIVLLREDAAGLPVYHEACSYHAASQSLFVTSSLIPSSEGKMGSTTSNKTVKVTRVYDHDDPSRINCMDATPADLPMANGGVNYKNGLLFCSQGDQLDRFSGGLVYVPDLSTPYKAEKLISSFYGRPFNSVNDVIVHPQDGSIWFTDPCYGYHQGIRPEPELPSQVYRFNPEEGSIRAMADDFVRPNGICFSPDLKMVYVTDTGAIHGAHYIPFDKTGKASIYAFDVLETKHGK